MAELVDQANIKVGGRYRGRNPVKVGDMFRTQWDDRTVIWVSRNRLALEYTSAQTKGVRKPESMFTFLQWAGRQLGEEEGSDVK